MSQIANLAPQGSAPAGDVVGPASSTDNAIARWDGVTGKLLQDSGILIDDNDNITFNGGMVYKRTATAISYVVLTDDHYIGVTDTSAPRTVSLPAAPLGAEQVFIIKDESGGAGTNSITIDVDAAAKTIDGAASFSLGSDFGAVAIGYNGTEYNILDVYTAADEGDVIGPASSTDNALARWDGVTGKVLQDSDYLFEDSPAGYAGSSLNHVKDVVQTTDATPTDLIQIPLGEDEMLQMECKINGFQSDFSDSISASINVKFTRQTAGDVTIGASPQIWISESDGATDVTIVADVANQEATIQVTGVAAQTWNWVSFTRYFKTITNS